MAWTDTFASGTDWSALTHLNMFVDACNERLNVLGLTTLSQYRAGGTAKTVGAISKSGATVTVTVTSHGYTTGRDIYLHTSDANYDGVHAITVTNSNTFTFSVLSTLADPVPGTYTSYLLPDDAQRASAVSAMQAVVRDRASSFYATGTPSGTSLSLSTLTYAGIMSSIGAGSKFTRKAPRTVASTSATQDIYGNARAVGQMAYLQTDSSIVTWDGTSWTGTGATFPDLLSNKNAAPNGMPTDTDGVMQAGDYFGPWIWNELRDALNKMTRTLATVVNVTVAGANNQGQAPNPPGNVTASSAAAAYSGAAASWTLSTNISTGNASAKVQIDHASGFSTYSCGLIGAFVNDLQAQGAYTGTAKTFTAWTSGKDPGTNDAFGNEYVFDSQGTSILRNTATVVYTEGPNSAANSGSFRPFTLACPPNFSAPAGTTYTHRTFGFDTRGILGVYDWQFTYR